MKIGLRFYQIVRDLIRYPRTKDMDNLTSVVYSLWTKTRWLGFEVAQIPTDLFAIQELLFLMKPDFVIETGTWHGGFTVFCASILELFNNGLVISIDVDTSIAKKKLENHFLRHRIKLLEGDSKSPEIFQKVREMVRSGKHILVFLDSAHDTSHVKAELDNFSKLVNVGDYIVVFDTCMDEIRGCKKSNPMIAVRQFLKENKNFTPEKHWEKYEITLCRNGFLKRIK